jgi:hypothetical protein
MAGNEVQARRGTCPAHGLVEGQREIPRMGFPFVVFAVRRLLAQRKPFTCPTCGSPIDTGS